MAGIYIHVPFCKSKCAYCNFFSIATDRHKADFIKALKREIVARRDYIGDEEIKTIYFGGGTPSLLSINEIKDILDTIGENFKISNSPETTLEANPDTLSEDYLKALYDLGINRLSIGIQSFFDDDLQYLSRKHDSRHARQVLDLSQKIGFPYLTIDLIYGIPTLTKEKWKQNLDIFFATGITHLSAYSLTIEPATVLGKKIANGTAQPVDEEAGVRHYETLVDRAAKEGFEHYEISNFAKNGHYSKHNSSYWNGEKYLGVGPAAHSFNRMSRQWNVSNLMKYNALAGMSDDCFEKETLTDNDRYNEYVMTSLRTMWGCDLEHVRKEFGEKYSRRCESVSMPYIASGKMQMAGNRLILNEQGMLFADGIAAEMFVS